MTALEEQILETWRIHNRIMVLVVEHIPAEGFEATLSQRGGRDVSRQLAHLHTVRMARLEPFAKTIKAPYLVFESADHPDRDELTTALIQSGEIMERYIEQSIANDGVVSNFRRGLVPMIGYMISHEAHHRGSILLTMKQCGHKLPEALKWGIWEWNKV